MKSQLYQDNGYTYKPAVLCVQWLQHYFAADKSNLHSSPPVCASVYQLGKCTDRYLVCIKLAWPIKRVSYYLLMMLKPACILKL